jgi:4-alpha-glucanotransferase
MNKPAEPNSPYSPITRLFRNPLYIAVEKVAAIIDAELTERRSAEAMAKVIAAVESLSDADVARLLATESQEKQT